MKTPSMGNLVQRRNWEVTIQDWLSDLWNSKYLKQTESLIHELNRNQQSCIYLTLRGYFFPTNMINSVVAKHAQKRYPKRSTSGRGTRTSYLLMSPASSAIWVYWDVHNSVFGIAFIVCTKTRNDLQWPTVTYFIKWLMIKEKDKRGSG